MKKYIPVLIGIATLATILFSCKPGKKDVQVNVEYGNIPPALIDSLRSIGQEIQQKEIDPSIDNVVKGRNGTVIYIPANSLVDEQGKPVSSNTIIELKEHYSIADYLTSNLQAVHNNDILQTQGMIYFSARTADGTILKIDSSKPVRIELPVTEKIAGAKIFTGTRDEDGNLNWSEINEPSKYLIPYPIHIISRNRFWTECPHFYGITLDTIKNKYFNYYGELSKFENTFLATREFKERYDVACWEDVVKIYIDNLDKNLWEADELVVQYFIKDSAERVNYQVSHVYPNPDGGPRTKDQREAHARLIAHDKEFGHRMITLFKDFAAERLTKIDPAKRIADTTVAEISKTVIAYDALQFGWVNVDYFFNDPKATEVKLIAKTNEAPAIISMVIPNRSVILSGMRKGDNTYYFTKNENGYNKLPKGEKAYIVAIGLADNKVYFADKEIVIGQNETEAIELKPATAETVKARMKNYGG